MISQWEGEAAARTGASRVASPYNVIPHKFSLGFPPATRSAASRNVSYEVNARVHRDRIERQIRPTNIIHQIA